MIKHLISRLSSKDYHIKSLEFRLNEDSLRVYGNRIKFFDNNLEFLDENRQSISVPYQAVKIVVEKRIDKRSYLIGICYYRDGCFYIPEEFPSDLERYIIDLGINVKKVPGDQIDEIF